MQLMRILTIFFLLQATFYSQTRLIEISSANLNLIDSAFFNINPSREIIQIDKNWKVSTDGSDESARISLPCIFQSDETLIFQKKINISKNLARLKNIYLKMLGVNYSIEVLFNSIQIYKGSPANLALSVLLPPDLISTQKANLLTIKIENRLDSKTTFPTKQRFLFPRNFGGFTRDIYLYSVPKIHISDLKTNIRINNSKNAEIDYKLTIEGNSVSKDTANTYNLTFDIFGKDKSYQVLGQRTIKISKSKTYLSGKLFLSNLNLWSPENPFYYKLRLKLISSSFVQDEIAQPVSFYRIDVSKSGIKLNSTDFHFNGVVFHNYPSYSEKKNDYEILEKKLKEIKAMGFNSVRFAKQTPHPYALRLCEKIGLFAIIELPINSVPESFFNDKEYLIRLEQYINSFGKAYSKYSSVAIVGLGSSFLSNSKTHLDNLNFIREKLSHHFNTKFYASFTGIPEKTDGIDFIGVELFEKNPGQFFSEKNIGRNILISEATYPNYFGNSSGYLNPFTTEAQAKYFEDVIDYSNENLGGFFLNSYTKYSGDFPSLITKFNKNNLYSLGIADNSENSLTKNVVNNKLKGMERVIIPIGTFYQDFPLFIIFSGLVLAVMLGILVNSKKKFREDATRALLRPYNFFADIRDHRVLSGFHTNALMLILAGSHSLLITNILYFLKNNFLFEKFLLSFGSTDIINFFGELAWNPVKCFIYFFIISIILFLAIAVIIKLMSLFLKTKVMFFNIYYVVVWSFLPLSVLLPVKLILYRVLSENIINIYIYVFLIIYLLWIFQRILKGTYVIFDTSRARVYSFGIIFFIIVFGGMMLYFQLTNSTISYILLSLKQYQLL
jgi:beta-galactosidase